MSLTTFLSLCCIGGRQLQLVQLIWGSVLLVKTGDILKNPDLMMTLLVWGKHLLVEIHVIEIVRINERQ